MDGACCPVAPGHVDMLNSTCAPVDLINRCNVTWNVCNSMYVRTFVLTYIYVRYKPATT